MDQADLVAIKQSQSLKFYWSPSVKHKIFKLQQIQTVAKKEVTLVLCKEKKSKVFNAFTSIGGDNGWFDYSYLWRIRGFIDKLIGGVGLSRGRRDSCDLRLGECLDFWRVEDIKEDERLLLFAQMKVPGEAWLEFKIQDGLLKQTATFRPRGLWGRLYWYSVLPFHGFIFRGMIKKLVDV